MDQIEEGTVEDLAHLRNLDGEPVRKNTNFKKPVAYQQPFSGQLGARIFF